LLHYVVGRRARSFEGHWNPDIMNRIMNVTRTEPEMLTLILHIAKNDERIRSVVLSGSRANPNTCRDIFQDFDITYLVSDAESFKNDREWIRLFGEIMILQMPEAMDDPPPANDGHFAYLMQFVDGNRIDLTLLPLSHFSTHRFESSSVLLLDKDSILSHLAPASDSDYLPTRPSAKEFDDCCNEFWWICTYVAKGLWREQITYAKYIFDNPLREQLMKMLVWYAGERTDFQQNIGAYGKLLQQNLEPALWELLKKSYSGAEVDETWLALLAACDLFRKTATHIAICFGFQYPHDDDKKVSAHLVHIRSLPKDASAIYEQ
jgi:aminoglycoside 6-adenylyltransferase